MKDANWLDRCLLFLVIISEGNPLNLFVELEIPNPKCFFDFAEAGDKCGALKHLQSLSIIDIEKQVLEAGFSMIGRHHGKSALLDYAVGQIGIKTPVKREWR